MKKSRYANIVHKGNDYLIHHSLFGGIVRASCDNSRSFLDMIESESSFGIDEDEKFHQDLLEMRMIVEDDVIESNLANFYLSKNPNELFIIMFVTKQCNFRCVYCCQTHEDKKMSDKTYDDMLKAIEGLIDANRYKVVRVSFFGGEPLLEYDAVCRFSERLVELAERKDVTYIGGMTTNGYLLTPERLKRLVELKVTEYQITVDGLKETHDKARVLLGDGSPWETIMENLISAKSSDIPFRFMVRTNFDDEIVQNATEFVEYLSQNFKGDSRFMYHFESVKNLDGATDIDFNLVADEASCMNEISLSAKKADLRVSSSETVIRPLGLACYATSNDSFSIDYDGTIMKCTVHVDMPKNRIGHISDEGITLDDYMMSNWTSFGLSEKCKSCKILPICFNKKCPLVGADDNACDRFTTMYENAGHVLNQ